MDNKTRKHNVIQLLESVYEWGRARGVIETSEEFNLDIIFDEDKDKFTFEKFMEHEDTKPLLKAILNVEL